MVCKFYKVNGKNFSELVAGVLKCCGKWKNIVRLVFFGDTYDNEDFLEQRCEVDRQVRAFFGDRCPAFSYVAQKPLDADLAVELHTLDPWFEGEVIYKIGTDLEDVPDLPYVILQGKGYRELIVSGLCGSNLDDLVHIQAEEAMSQMMEVLLYEGFEVKGIARQWNYLEDITAMEERVQRYRHFNKTRSCFYSTASWKYGYPAATGIGMQWGGLLLDFTAIDLQGEGWRSCAVDNSLQVAAHAYSQRVLKGGMTPKFERAKAFYGEEGGIVFISGTAAIRGEQSSVSTSVEEQLQMTMENIDFLISEENLQKAGIMKKGMLQTLRVYLKNEKDFPVVKEYMERNFKTLPVLYLLADICREELLVEVEGVALLH
ncbi:Rid family hydrolase [Odoribacter lunatus]|uniref:chorismate transformation enzyme, FkbO/Hyg5 family n=1 Tax=Odoribacter lunatus TaxID=2941335 RepID=UPI00203FBE47|nr:Rid family hydrolase [Odoribacter lunatus]